MGSQEVDERCHQRGYSSFYLKNKCKFKVIFTINVAILG